MARKATAKGVVLPGKLGNKARATLPGRDTARQGDTLPVDSRPSNLNATIASIRAMRNAVAALRQLEQQEGAFSFAVFAYVQAAMSGIDISAYDTATNQFSPEGTQLARQVINQIDTLYDYSMGFADKRGLDSVLETMLKDVALSGGVAGELVLNKQRLPDRINTVPYETLRWVLGKEGHVYPEQESGSEKVDLNIPNFFVGEMGKGSDKAYAGSFLFGAIKQVFYYAEFIEDMRRAVRRAGHTRMAFKLDYEKIRSAAPPEVQADAAKMKTYLDTVREDFSRALEELEPEDAIVCYDFATVDGIDAKGEKADYSEIMDAVSSLMATSVKTHPSILGLRLGGSQSLSNTESLIFIKGAKALQLPVESVLSRALTLSTRLYGADIYVKFAFKPIDLRPEQELEAFKTMRQQRIMQALSMGWITDDEASHMLGYGPRAPNAPDLSGSLFMDNNQAFNSALKASPNADPQGRALQPDTPSRAGGKSQ